VTFIKGYMNSPVGLQGGVVVSTVDSMKGPQLVHFFLGWTDPAVWSLHVLLGSAWGPLWVLWLPPALQKHAAVN